MIAWELVNFVDVELWMAAAWYCYCYCFHYHHYYCYCYCYLVIVKWPLCGCGWHAAALVTSITVNHSTNLFSSPQCSPVTNSHSTVSSPMQCWVFFQFFSFTTFIMEKWAFGHLDIQNRVTYYIVKYKKEICGIDICCKSWHHTSHIFNLTISLFRYCRCSGKIHWDKQSFSSISSISCCLSSSLLLTVRTPTLLPPPTFAITKHQDRPLWRCPILKH